MRMVITFLLISTLNFAYTITIPLKEYQQRVDTQSSKYKDISLLWDIPYKLNGKDIKIAIFDGGKIFKTHTELIGQSIFQDKNMSLSTHATAITGIIMAKGIDNKARGIANQATLYNYYFKKYFYSSAIKKALADNIKISNHSYSNIYKNQTYYSKENRKIDSIIYNNPTTIAIFAAGNIKRDKKFFIKNITTNSTSKNILTIGSSDIEDKKILKISARGPTSDFRIKPDFVFRGLFILTLDTTDAKSYYLQRGTSYSTAFVTGIVALISQAYKKRFDKDIDFATLKSILIVNAKDIAIKGVDIFSGYGRVDAKKSVDFLLDKNFSHKSSLQTIKLGEIKKYNFKLNKQQDIKISTCWIDPPAKKKALKSLVNDIDSYIMSKKRKYYPYSVEEDMLKVVKTKQNTRDNCEVIEYKLPKGSYSFFISGKKLKSSQKVSTASNIPIF